MDFSSYISSPLPLIDVRSPAEFEQGHVPGAHSMALFTNEERHEVGKCYKQQGKDAAVKLGLEYVGPKLASFVEQAEELAPEKKLVVHCWRGGMRSGSMAWLLKTAGFEVETINGGYKAYRNWVLDILSTKRNYIALGGFTGVGKSNILEALEERGEQIVHLERIAKHKGSAFGKTKAAQPSSEQFENNLAQKLNALDCSKPIWIEDESKSIGTVYMNHQLVAQLKSAPLVLIEMPLKQRIAELVKDYGDTDISHLKQGFQAISKRMGGQHLNAALEALDQNDLASAAEIALNYYDKAYAHAMNRVNRNPILTLTNLAPNKTAKRLIEWQKTLR